MVSEDITNILHHKVALFVDVWICSQDISGTTLPNLITFCMLHVAFGLVILWLQCDVLHTFSFVSGVIFLFNGPCGSMMLQQQPH